MTHGKKSVEEQLILTSAIGTIAEILDAVGEDIDSDFNGANGKEYLWDEAKNQCFDSNKMYLINRVSSLKPEEAVEEFLKVWLYYDGYYKDYAYELRNIGQDKYYISVAVVF